MNLNLLRKRYETNPFIDLLMLKTNFAVRKKAGLYKVILKEKSDPGLN